MIYEDYSYNCGIDSSIVRLLQDFLYEAIFVPEEASAPQKSIINQPELQIVCWRLNYIRNYW